ncbi:superoxide dismutase family protein [Paenibacillus sp. JDR-2]|uniref:superoxide dismutase family protein n=1 Tax=Paenibacillus sp. (strain JDR-2) TaxID=324057 RepID=UPI000166B1EC|nr:superoxide dismutase family protein [Paenibacillus sp. JDR-2]ACS99136.1 superoxide dismutase copper/zinc binding [Paenibacillus sp. JDR-2]
MNKSMMLCSLGFLVASCGFSSAAMASQGHGHHTRSHVMEAKAAFIDTKGNQIGTVVLTEEKDGVHLKLEAKGLTPGVHGIHFHNVGKCEAPSFESAGSHLNPKNKQHGFDNPQGFHDGDLPNITVDKDGTVKADIISKNVTLDTEAPNSLLPAAGTALVIHEKADDYKTDPSGNSGSRIACGVIQH